MERPQPMEEDRLAFGADGGADGGCDVFVPQLCSTRGDEPDCLPAGLANSNLLRVVL
jgi:hypothetical protein